jgi:hypothetical protein
VKAGRPGAARSSASFSAGVDKRGIAVSGEALTVQVSLKDKFGNLSEGEASHECTWL